MVVKILLQIDNFIFTKKDISVLRIEEGQNDFEYIIRLENFQNGYYYFELKQKEGQIIQINNKKYKLVHIYADFLINELTLKVQEEEGM